MKRPRRIPIWLAVVLAIPVVIGLFVLGLFTYVSVTAYPLHPDAAKITGVMDSPPAPAWSTAIDQGRQAARTSIVAQNLPGLSVAVGLRGELLWGEGFGWADIDSQAQVTPHTRFRVTDASKALTSAAVGLLLEKQALQLDDDIRKYVPEFPKKQWPVTLRQLMAQTGGVMTDQGDEAPIAERCDKTIDGLKLDGFANKELRFEPGTRYFPSSYGWVLVSAAVEAAAQDKFFSFMRGQVFEPLKMADTRPDSEQEPPPNRATFYFPRFGGDTKYGPESAREGDHVCFAGAGAFLSTPSDLVRFGMAMTDGTLLQPNTVKTLQTSQHLASGADTGYGLGWKLDTVQLGGKPAQVAGHGSKSDFIGGSTYLMTFPDRHLVVAVMTNESFADMKAIALAIAQGFAETIGNDRERSGTIGK